MTPFDYMAGIAIMLLYSIAAITLFLMRKMALYFFLGAVCLELALLLLGFGSHTEVMMVGGDYETMVEMLNIAISVVFCGYAFLLTQTGRLR